MRSSNSHVILIGAGELDRSQAMTIQQEKQKGAYVIALDGGLMFCSNYGIEPDMIVGDFDSLEQKLSEEIKIVKGKQEICEASDWKAQELLSKYSSDIIYRLPCEKDDTDTLAAIKMAVEKGFKSFSIYGGLGGRLSHTVANIQSLLYLKEQGLHGELIGDGSKVFLIKDESIVLQPIPIKDEDICLQVFTEEVQKPKNAYISIFSYTEKAQGVTLKNLKYEITDAELSSSFPIGVSNEFIGKAAEISVKDGVLLIIVER